MNAITLIIIYLVSVNCISFIVMGVDKHKARKRAWRIPESTLFVLALIGGSLGSILGMHLFRHNHTGIARTAARNIPHRDSCDVM